LTPPRNTRLLQRRAIRSSVFPTKDGSLPFSDGTSGAVYRFGYGDAKVAVETSTAATDSPAEQWRRRAFGLGRLRVRQDFRATAKRSIPARRKLQFNLRQNVCDAGIAKSGAAGAQQAFPADFPCSSQPARSQLAALPVGCGARLAKIANKSRRDSTRCLSASRADRLRGTLHLAALRSAGQGTMRFTSLFDRLCRRACELRSAIGANVTVTFSFAMVPVVGFVGAAVDYSHANSVKVAMQAALDSTALMLSKSVAGMTESQIQTTASDYFKALFNRPESTGLTVTANYSTIDGSKVVLNATTNVKTDFMGLMGVPQMKISVGTQVKWGNTRLRVALALDTTGSMDADGKIEALKSATKSLLLQLKASASKNGDVYVSIIPFSKDVRFDKTAYTESWIRWDLWEDKNGDCSDNDYKSRTSCINHGKTWTADSRSKWNGCITDRDKDFDTTNTAPNVDNNPTRFPAEQYGSCPAQLLGLTYDWTALNDKVDDLYPSGNTNQGIGIAWAYQSLTASPFTIPPKDPSFKYTDVIILMSDGLNTQNRFSSSQSAIDERELITCTSAKNAGIVIYTVQVNTGGDPTQDVMKKCATSVDKFTEIKKANQMVSAFTSIGTALSNLRIAQ
jgi:Flp pilus assembly protein TadG